MKIFRAYILTAIACISITSLAASVFIADENARKIMLGEDYAVMVLTSTDEAHSENTINPLPLLKKIRNAAEKAASIAPPPFSNIYWFIINSEKTESQTQIFCSPQFLLYQQQAG